MRRRLLTDLDPYLSPPWRDPPQPRDEPWPECPPASRERPVRACVAVPVTRGDFLAGVGPDDGSEAVF